MGLFNQGLTLMTYGISMVFIFLGVLIAAMTLMSAILRKLPEPKTKELGATPQALSNTSSSSPAQLDTNLLAVLQAAITEHRTRKSL